MKEKYIQVEMPNGEKWEVPAKIIAEGRAKYYADKEKNEDEQTKIFCEEYDYTIDNDDELIDWAENNMNWSDVKKFAKKIKDNHQLSKDDFEEGWCNGEKEILVK